MKTLLSLLCALSLGAILPAQTPPVSRPGSQPGPAAKKNAPVTEEEKEGVITGLTLARPNGKFLGLEIVAGNWKLSFYDEKKQPTPLDVVRGNVRWVIQGKADNERTVLNPGADGRSLFGSRFVRPPYQFKLFLTLLKGEGDEHPETYTLDFRA